ncbi:hypothetical protein TWF281_011244 [Arthrobotrys megalospora]
MGSSVETLKNKAQESWTENFIDGPYSNLIQADYLVSKSGASWEQILKDPKILKTRITDSQLQDDNSLSFKRTWATAAGRCTSFAVRIVRRLQEYNSPSFDFKFYDLKGHRVARCALTGILIDSSSAVGVLVVKDGGEWVTLDEGEENNPKWKWDGSDSKFKTDRQGLKKSEGALTVQQCMTQCLSEVRDRFEPLCLFRSFTGGRAHFHGMIKWEPTKKQLLLIEDLGNRKNTTRTIAFGPSGTKDTENECIEAVKNFISQHGGPEGERQWKFGQPDHRAEDVHGVIWRQAISLWGLPHMK